MMLRRRMLRRKTDPKSGERHLFASLHRRHAHGHFTRAIFCGNFTGKRPDAPG